MKLRLMILLFALSSCGAPVRLNPTASVPVTVTDEETVMALGKRAGINQYTWMHGLCLYAPQAIYIARGYELDYTLPHECAHLADQLGGDYARAIRLITPDAPTADFAGRLETLWDISRSPRGYWAEIYHRWGRDAVWHPEVLARIAQ
jgi:hypothetical protein